MVIHFQGHILDQATTWKGSSISEVWAVNSSRAGTTSELLFVPRASHRKRTQLIRSDLDE